MLGIDAGFSDVGVTVVRLALAEVREAPEVDVGRSGTGSF